MRWIRDEINASVSFLRIIFSWENTISGQIYVVHMLCTNKYFALFASRPLFCKPITTVRNKQHCNTYISSFHFSFNYWWIVSTCSEPAGPNQHAWHEGGGGGTHIRLRQWRRSRRRGEVVGANSWNFPQPYPPGETEDSNSVGGHGDEERSSEPTLGIFPNHVHQVRLKTLTVTEVTEMRRGCWSQLSASSPTMSNR
jgi:hypothetical protein